MSVLYFLIPISIVMLIIAIGGFFWAINSGQYDDLDRHAREILLEDACDKPKADAMKKHRCAPGTSPPR